MEITQKQNLTFDEQLALVDSQLDAQDSEAVFKNIGNTVEKIKCLQMEIMKIYQEINRDIPDETQFLAFVKLINKRVDKGLLKAKKPSLDEVRKLLAK